MYGMCLKEFADMMLILQDIYKNLFNTKLSDKQSEDTKSQKCLLVTI